MIRLHLGRHVFGLAAIAFGVITLVWHDLNVWQQIQPLGNVPHRAILLYIIAAIEIIGGIAIQWPKTARDGAIALGAINLIFALLWLPLFIHKPLVYDSLGNFFEQFSMVSGALIVFASFSPGNPAQAAKLARIGYFSFAICVVSFTIVHIVSFSAVVDFVPKWIPPGQMFWAIATTVAFALAAVALFTGRSALLASRLLTAMILGFGLLIWLPAPFTSLMGPHNVNNWAGNAENLGIAAAAWIIADYLAQQKQRSHSERSAAE